MYVLHVWKYSEASLIRPPGRLANLVLSSRVPYLSRFIYIKYRAEVSPTLIIEVVIINEVPFRWSVLVVHIGKLFVNLFHA